LIPQSFIQDLLNRVDIVAVVERYVALKRAGANYVACCPFHSEKTPSFTVSPSKQFYHCFGCGAHGTAVGFVMEHTGAGFVDAVKDLAQGAGMQVPDVRSERPRGKSEEGDDLYAVLLKAAHYYRRQLRLAPRAIDYLRQRGLSGEVAKQFGIGYAPQGWQSLQAVFPDYGSGALIAAGLVAQGADGKRHDRFRDRIMFPIVDQRGNIIGFGGRVLGEGEPKYLNSPETPVFEKGHELYGLYQGRRAIREAGRVVVVEGYMDVVALAQHGIGYAVATLGTATTSVHVQKLLRQADEVVFCFDGDAAGRRAAWRALENSLGQLNDGKQVKFLFLPDGEDPDTYVRKSGREAFEKFANEAQPLSIFMLRELGSQVDRTSQEGRAGLLQKAQPLVKQIPAPALGLLIRKQLAEMAGVTVAELNALYGESDKRPQRVVERRMDRKSPEGNNYIMAAACLLHRPELVDSCRLDPNWEASPALNFLRELVAFIKDTGGEASFALIIQHFAGGDGDRFLEKAIAKQSGWNENWDIPSELDGALRQIRAEFSRTSLTPLLAADRAGAWTDEEEKRFSQWQQEHRQLMDK
jgi:DNA primase